MDPPPESCASTSRHMSPVLRRYKGTSVAEPSCSSATAPAARPTRPRHSFTPDADSQRERRHIHRQKSDKDLIATNSRHTTRGLEDSAKRQRGVESPLAHAVPVSSKPSYSDDSIVATPLPNTLLKVKTELDSAKKNNQEYKRYIRKQEKRIEQLKEEIEALKKTQLERDANAQQTTRKSEEFVTAVETAIQCQICMETLTNPFSLKCGHIYCLSCLQQWFRNTPRPDDDEDEEDLEGDEYVMAHDKSCPTCRAIIQERPAPLFMVKYIIGALDSYKGVVSPQSPVSEEDPWKGIFYPPGHQPRRQRDPIRNLLAFRHAFSDEEDQYEEAAEGFDDDDRDTWASSVFGGYGSEEEFFDPVDDEYTLARYEPPRLNLVSAYGHLYEEELDMLKRGCTIAMIRRFHMSYSDESGLLAVRDDETQIYLGWNITLDEDDLDGSQLINSIMLEVMANSPQWEVVPWSGGRQGAFVARRRVMVLDLEDRFGEQERDEMEVDEEEEEEEEEEEVYPPSDDGESEDENLLELARNHALRHYMY